MDVMGGDARVNFAGRQSPRMEAKNVLNQRRLNQAYDDVSSGADDNDEGEDNDSSDDPMEDESNNETANIE